MIARAASFLPDEIATATAGQVEAGAAPADRPFAGVATDTRDPLENGLFVALVGARHDAHHFLKAAVDAGATGLLVERARFEAAGGRDTVGREVAVFFCADTTWGLGQLGQHHRRRLKTPLIAVTGSNGKTTTKEMLAAIAGVEEVVHATPGNLNNLIGLPLTLLGLEPTHTLCIAEMGMNALGEIARLTEIAEPDLGLVTNVGPAHIGELGSLGKIAEAKGELYRGLPDGAVRVFNADDPRVSAAALALGPGRGFGKAASADVRVLESTPRGEGQDLSLSIDGAELSVQLSLPGAHNALNAAAAAAAMTAPGGPVRVSSSSIASGLAAVKPAHGRLSVKNIGPWRVIDDSYNANAASTLAAISTAQALAGGGRWVAALGEMRELGTFSEAAHAEVGRAAAEAGAACLAAFGPGAAPAARAFGGPSRHEAEDFDALADWLMGQLREGDSILVKGSRGSRMERLVERLEAAADKDVR